MARKVTALALATLLTACTTAPQTVVLLPPKALLTPLPAPTVPANPTSEDVAVFIALLAEWGETGWRRVQVLRDWREELDD